MAISYWLAFGNPTLLRLGNSNKFDCSRLNRSVSLTAVQASSVRVYSDLGCCRKAVKEKISTKGQACLKPKVDIFYFNNSQSYPKSASAQKRNEVSQKVFARPAFFKKRAVLRSLIIYIGTLLNYEQGGVAVGEEAEVVCEGVVVYFMPVVAHICRDEQQQCRLWLVEVSNYAIDNSKSVS